MASILVRLHKFESEEDAQKTADGIRNAGGLNYIDASSGDVVNVTVGDVTVENNA